jgi:hypothetical protein
MDEQGKPPYVWTHMIYFSVVQIKIASDKIHFMLLLFFQVRQMFPAVGDDRTFQLIVSSVRCPGITTAAYYTFILYIKVNLPADSTWSGLLS